MEDGTRCNVISHCLGAFINKMIPEYMSWAFYQRGFSVERSLSGFTQLGVLNHRLTLLIICIRDGNIIIYHAIISLPSTPHCWCNKLSPFINAVVIISIVVFIIIKIWLSWLISNYLSITFFVNFPYSFKTIQSFGWSWYSNVKD